MEFNSPNFPGLGQQLNNVLAALDLNSDPVWTLKQTRGKVYLDIVWDKKIKSPATGVVNKEANTQRNTALDYKPSSPLRADVKPRLEPDRKKMKNKSPSTRKRDKERFEKWKARKRTDLKSPCSTSFASETRPIPYPSHQSIPHVDSLDSPAAVMVNNKGPALEKPATLSVPCPPQEVVMEAPKLTSAGSDSDPRDSDCDLIGETPEEICANCHRPESMIPGRGLYVECFHYDVCDTKYCSIKCRTEHLRCHRILCGRRTSMK